MSNLLVALVELPQMPSRSILTKLNISSRNPNKFLSISYSNELCLLRPKLKVKLVKKLSKIPNLYLFIVFIINSLSLLQRPHFRDAFFPYIYEYFLIVKSFKSCKFWINFNKWRHIFSLTANNMHNKIPMKKTKRKEILVSSSLWDVYWFLIWKYFIINRIICIKLR